MSGNLQRGFGIERLYKASMPDAFHNSAARWPFPRCHPETRKELIGKIVDWGADLTNDYCERILRIDGPAGAGKTAIAQTCAEIFVGKGKLAASIFFSCRAGTSPEHLFTSLSYQIAVKSGHYYDIIDDKVQRDVTLAEKATIGEQFQKLFVEPFQQLKLDGNSVDEGVVIIDGLDECTEERKCRDIINIITSSVRMMTTPFRWLITSRAAEDIVASFNMADTYTLSIRVQLSISHETDNDVRCFLEGELKNLGERFRLPPSWLSNEDILALVKFSGGFFQWATTAIRFIDQPGLYNDHARRLAVVLQHASGESGEGFDRPFKSLDSFYDDIMHTIPLGNRTIFQKVLLLFRPARCSNAGNRSTMVANILKLSREEYQNVHYPLHAVLRLSPSNDEPMFYHPSFLDYIMSSERSGKFCIYTALEDLRLELLEYLNHIHSDGLSVIRFTWERLQEPPSDFQLNLYGTMLRAFFHLSQFLPPLEDKTTAVLSTFRFSEIPSTLHNIKPGLILLRDRFSPERFRELIPRQYRDQIVRRSSNLFIPQKNLASVTTGGRYLFGRGSNSVSCYADRSGDWRFTVRSMTKLFTAPGKISRPSSILVSSDTRSDVVATKSSITSSWLRTPSEPIVRFSDHSQIGTEKPSYGIPNSPDRLYEVTNLQDPSNTSFDDNSSFKRGLPGPTTTLPSSHSNPKSAVDTPCIPEDILDCLPGAIVDVVEKMDRDDIQVFTNYLDSVLDEETFTATDHQNHILTLLSRIAVTTRVFPQRYILRPIEYDTNPVAEGGFGDVYQALDQTVCVKVMKRTSDEVLKSYIKELILWSRVKHPNVLPFFGIFLSLPNQRMSLVSPWMKNGNLSNYAARLPQKDRIKLLSDVVEGLTHLHELGIVHSDIKGQNVLVSDEGRALITDFGASHIATNAMKQGTTQSLVAHSTNFAAPEILERLFEAANVRPNKGCDIWSFGCLCYEILTRRIPFEGLPIFRIFRILCNDREHPTRPTAGDAGCEEVDDKAWALMIACWAFDPAARPNCQDIRGMIARFEISDNRPIGKRIEKPEVIKAESKVDINLVRAGQILRGLQAQLAETFPRVEGKSNSSP